MNPIERAVAKADKIIAANAALEAASRPAAQADLPTAVGSVVWCHGHPFVLDGEPGIPTPRRWVGIGAGGRPIAYNIDRMRARTWTLMHDATEAEAAWLQTLPRTQRGN